MQTNLGNLLKNRSATSPTLEALVDVDTATRTSYADLNAYSNRCANSLSKLGISKGDRVALLLSNGLEFVGLFYGAAKLGAIVVPLNTRLSSGELAFMLQDSGTSVVLYDAVFSPTVDALKNDDACRDVVNHWVRCGGGQGQADSTEQLLAELLSAADAGEPKLDYASGDDDPLFIMYTSGTTGTPKGVVHTHQSIFWAATSWLVSIDVRHADRLLLPLPMFHVAALTTVLFSMLRGVTIVSMAAFEPVRAWDLIEGEHVTIGGAVPAILNFMLQVPGVESKNADSLRFFISGAAPLPAVVIERYQNLGIDVIQGYALTESGGGGSLLGADYALPNLGSAGQASLFTDICVVDGAGAKHSKGTGEIWMRAKHMMAEYWNRPDATDDAFDGGWFKTGDIAEIDDEGFIFIKDRIKDMIISGGENVYPAEVEAAIQSHPQVREVAVIGHNDEKWGETVRAVIVAAQADLTEDDIMEHCQGKLSRYKQPRMVSFVDELPRNASGKVLKRNLRERFEAV